MRAWERVRCSLVNLRLNADASVFQAGLLTALGLALPLVPHTVACGHDISILWLRPNEWLIMSSREREAAIVHDLCETLHGLPFAVTAGSGEHTIVGLRGNRVHDLLAQGGVLDLHPHSFGPGRCTETHLATIPILLRQLDMEPSFELIVQDVDADYLWLWLVDAAEKYGLEVASVPVAGMASIDEIDHTSFTCE